MVDASIEYYDRRADEYDATSWEHPGGDAGVAARVRDVLSALPNIKTIDVGCGTGYVSRWLPGQLTLMDASSAMLLIARRRLPGAGLVRSKAPSLPFADHSFGRAFAGNLFGHLASFERSELAREMRRVAAELVVLEQLSVSGSFSEGPEERTLVDGSKFTIHKCYFTVDRLLEELGGEILMGGPGFAIIRHGP
ncbi:MAG: class I SAM-dependent methyltransferase [Hyphomicrobiales bacterium]